MQDNEANYRSFNDRVGEALFLAFGTGGGIVLNHVIIRIEGKIRFVDYVVYTSARNIVVINIVALSEQNADWAGPDQLVIASPYGGSVVIRPMHDVQTAAQVVERRARSIDLPVKQTFSILLMPNLRFNQLASPSEDSDLRPRVFFGDGFTARAVLEFVGEAPVENRNAFRSSFETEQFERTFKKTSTLVDPAHQSDSKAAEENLRDAAHDYVGTNADRNMLFISYRREDTRWTAAAMYEYLRSMRLAGTIFFDRRSIPYGVPWFATIMKALTECVVQLVLIGERWETLKAKRGALTRIMDVEDVLAFEIAMALALHVVIIPVVIERSGLPEKKSLPAYLAGVCDLQAVFIDHNDFYPKMVDLTNRISQLLGAVP